MYTTRLEKLRVYFLWLFLGVSSTPFYIYSLLCLWPSSHQANQADKQIQEATSEKLSTFFSHAEYLNGYTKRAYCPNTYTIQFKLLRQAELIMQKTISSVGAERVKV